MTLTMDTLTAFSANVNFLTNANGKPAVTVPLVQGMGFVTALYQGATPYIDSSVFFRTVTPLPSPKTGVTKYRIILEDGRSWLLYATANNGTGLALDLTGPTRLKAPGFFDGRIQIARNPGNDATQEPSWDRCAGAYATGATVSGSVNGGAGSYALTFAKAGNGAPLMMFALPHHVESMDGATAAGKTGIRLQTTTKGVALGVVGDRWTMVEPDLPTGIGFAPWDVNSGSTRSIPSAARSAINAAGASELAQDMDAQSNLNSMYFSGKALSKFATAIYALHDLAGNVPVAREGLTKLKQAFARFATNRQQYPLVYESSWGGVVSSAAYVTGDAGADFGNS